MKIARTQGEGWMDRQASVGKRVNLGHCAFVRDGNTIGDDVTIGSFTEVSHDCHIGDRTRIHSHCFIAEYSIIDADVWIGPRVTLLNDKYPRSRKVSAEQRQRQWRPVIEDHVIIGGSSTIGPGVVIARGAIVGCGSLVLTDVPAYGVVAGSPARLLKTRSDIEEYSEVLKLGPNPTL